jgi:hypothetical protein
LVFISYSTKDMPRVLEVERALTDSQIEVFIAEHSVRPGDHLAQTIMDAIRRCDLFVLLWSKNSEESRWVSQEVGAAASAEKPIIPIVLDAGVPLPSFAAELKYIPAYEDPLQAFDTLRNEILQRARPLPDASAFAMLGILLIVLLVLYKEGPMPAA